jgi:hypothetical protein
MSSLEQPALARHGMTVAVSVAILSHWQAKSVTPHPTAATLVWRQSSAQVGIWAIMSWADRVDTDPAKAMRANRSGVHFILEELKDRGARLQLRDVSR